jgi:hypothetical protein
MGLKLKPTKEELERLYWEEKLPTTMIAGIFSLSKTTVLEWMKKYHIPRRTRSEATSLKLKELWKTPDYRNRMMKYLKEYWSRSDERSRNTKKLWENPRFRRQMLRIRGTLWKDPNLRRKLGDARKRMWQSKDYKGKVIEKMKRRWKDLEFREKMHKANQKAWQNPERKERQREIASKLWQNLEYREKVLRKAIYAVHKRPTNSERELIRIIRQYNLPFKYVGDGSFIIGNLNPDFVHNNGDKKIIEVFGRAFHDPDYTKAFLNISWHRQYFGRIAYYAQFCYDCLIIWDDELNNEVKVAEKIRRFSKCA